MEPLSPNDPLHALLGKARPVEPRPNFTQNVMRAVRQTPQSLTLAERLQGWLSAFTVPRLALAATAAVAGILAVVAWPATETQTAVVVQTTPVQAHLPAVVDEMLFSATEKAEAEAIETAQAQQDYSDVDPMGLLLVQEDTSALTDSEIALLVY